MRLSGNLDLMFDYDLCVGVASTLTREHGITAVADDVEIGISVVRIDPEGAERGILVTPGHTEAGQTSWILSFTQRYEAPDTGKVHYLVDSDTEEINLGLDLDSPLDAVAEAVATRLRAINVLAAFADLIADPAIADGSMRAALARKEAYEAAGIDACGTDDTVLGTAYTYCVQHVRPHPTGWCHVSVFDQIPMRATNAADAGAEARANGWPIFGE